MSNPPSLGRPGLRRASSYTPLDPKREVITSDGQEREETTNGNVAAGPAGPATNETRHSVGSVVRGFFLRAWGWLFTVGFLILNALFYLWLLLR